MLAFTSVPGQQINDGEAAGKCLCQHWCAVVCHSETPGQEHVLWKRLREAHSALMPKGS